MLNKKARELIHYKQIVVQTAADISLKELDDLDTEHLKKRLGGIAEKWEFKDLYRFLTDIKRYKRKTEHDIITAEAIFNSLPWAAQQAAQEVVRLLIKKAEDNLLFKMNETADMVANLLFNIFDCMKIDIKDTAQIMQEQKRAYSYNDLKENKLLLDFIRELRKLQWYKHGEVTRLRRKEC